MVKSMVYEYCGWSGELGENVIQYRDVIDGTRIMRKACKSGGEVEVKYGVR